MKMLDYNEVEYMSVNLIPNQSICRAKIEVMKGGEGSNEWVTRSKNSGSTYLKCKFQILTINGKAIEEDGLYNATIYNYIGISGNEWFVKKGKATIRAILESSANVSRTDSGEEAMEARRINDYGELNGREVEVRVGISRESSEEYQPRNVILEVLVPTSEKMCAGVYMTGRKLDCGIMGTRENELANVRDFLSEDEIPF
jgi:hypothetical protein